MSSKHSDSFAKTTGKTPAPHRGGGHQKGRPTERPAAATLPVTAAEFKPQNQPQNQPAALDRIGSDWMISHNGVQPRHPFHEQNQIALRLMLRTVESLPFEFVERNAYIVTDPKAKRTITEDLYHENGKRLTDPSDLVWRWGNIAGSTWDVLDVKMAYLGEQVPIPEGVAIVRPTAAHAEKLREAAAEFQQLFFNESKNPSIGFNFWPERRKEGHKILLGYSKTKLPRNQRMYMPTIADNLSYLNLNLREIVVSVAKGLADLLGITDYDRIMRWAILFAGYVAKRGSLANVQTGFPMHTDGVKDFDNYPGVVANLAINHSRDPSIVNKKLFDLVHITGDQQVIRLDMRQGDMCILSGAPRFEWGHSVPNHPDPQITVAFKLPFEDLSHVPKTYVKVMRNPSINFGKPVFYLDMAEALRQQKAQPVE